MEKLVLVCVVVVPAAVAGRSVECVFFQSHLCEENEKKNAKDFDTFRNWWSKDMFLMRNCIALNYDEHIDGYKKESSLFSTNRM